MIHEANPIIRFIKYVRELENISPEKSDTFPRCPIDKEPCAHYDSPLCNNFNCDAINMRTTHNESR